MTTKPVKDGSATTKPKLRAPALLPIKKTIAKKDAPEKKDPSSPQAKASAGKYVIGADGKVQIKKLPPQSAKNMSEKKSKGPPKLF